MNRGALNHASSDGAAHTLLTKAQRVVIKIGSALLFDPKTGLQTDWMAGLAADVAALKQAGKQVILVSSGSIALGRDSLGMPTGRIKLDEKQAAAATGQIQLAQAWMEALRPHDIKAAQILLAPEDTETRRRHLNARATMQRLLDYGVVPVVNENDTITTYEIRFGDNDRLAARVAAMMSADVLILLSDIDGLYHKNPRHHADARHIPVIDEITDEVLQMGGSANSDFASGGMATKLAAARIATTSGVAMIICDGQTTAPLSALSQGARASLFTAKLAPSTARKNWILSALETEGQVKIDSGAVGALRGGKSLLPAGVTHVSGQFDRGDLIDIADQEGVVLARGLAGYAHQEAQQLIGQKSTDFESIIGYEGRAELVHADDIVLMNGAERQKTDES